MYLGAPPQPVESLEVVRLEWWNMKALILAAGLGTRLLPFTRTTPKPLFPIAGRPLVDLHINALQDAGCEAIIINTHHLSRKIEDYIANQHYPIPVYTRYEPKILGTGGGIKNVDDFWDGSPFFVINSDIVTDIDLKTVYDFHLHHPFPVTLVLYNCPEINTVSMSADGFITGFDPKETRASALQRTFTGIQVLDPEILQHIPGGVFSSSIDAYGKLISAGKKVKAFLPQNAFWTDIGLPERYTEIIFQKIAPRAFNLAFPNYSGGTIARKKLKGDGSDRIWYRLTSEGRSLIMVAHGIHATSKTAEIDAFIAIGRHLYDNGIPVPKIYLYDRFAGQVFLEDLGDTHLQTVVRQSESQDKIVSCYKKVLRLLVNMSTACGEQFDRSWAYQTPAYDLGLILGKECRYFVEAFLQGYLHLPFRFSDFEDEFSSLAAKALRFGIKGFMHRDFQSRNIMVKQNKYYVIDFQGGRIGPIQYDLAALLIDPYVALPAPLQQQLKTFCADLLSSVVEISKDRFFHGYHYCAITRNLQILGAFAYLTRIKNKPGFSKYIPAALNTLRDSLDEAEFPKLRSVVVQIISGSNQ